MFPAPRVAPRPPSSLPTAAACRDPRPRLTESWLLQDTTWRRLISGIARPARERGRGAAGPGPGRLGEGGRARPARLAVRTRAGPGPFKPRRAGARRDAHARLRHPSPRLI